VTHCGSFYGQTSSGEPLAGAITVAGLASVLAALPPGVTELGCHPSDATEHWSSYAHERQRECHTLCDGEIRAIIGREAIELISFNDLAPSVQPAAENPHGNNVTTLSRGSV
jgi:predicted glycoside hydrolase/deacetylase ChbG (UPF0249 family)